MDQKTENWIEHIWRTYLLTGKPPDDIPLQWFQTKTFRKFIRRLPKEPRCRSCAAPFEGFGGLLTRNFAGITSSRMNPYMCNICERFAQEFRGGAEIELSMLFGDVRGSTTIAEKMSPSKFRDLIQRFYQVSSKVLFQSNAMVEKLIGDEVAGLYVPGNTGNEHARSAIEAARTILDVTGHNRQEGPWIPVGVGVHTGIAFVGSVISEGIASITALGDEVNLAARLASVAKMGEVVISDQSKKAAGLSAEGLESRDIQLKGKSMPIKVWILKVGAGQSAPQWENAAEHRFRES